MCVKIYNRIVFYINMDDKRQNEEYKKFKEAINKLHLNNHEKDQICKNLNLKLLFDIWRGKNIIIQKYTSHSKNLRLSYLIIWAAILLAKKYENVKKVIFITCTTYHMLQVHDIVSSCNITKALSICIPCILYNINADIVFMYGGDWSKYLSKDYPPKQIIIQRFDDEPDCI